MLFVGSFCWVEILQFLQIASAKKYPTSPCRFGRCVSNGPLGSKRDPKKNGPPNNRNVQPAMDLMMDDLFQ